ncbi:MAG: DUF3052 domain-containing protein [Planctomycetota bacterium JB042]
MTLRKPRTKGGAGYSGTPLPKKLGIAEGGRVLVKNGPPHLDDLLAPLPDGVTLSTRAQGSFGTILFFTKRRAELARALPALEPKLADKGGLWVCWPKKASKVETDVTEDVVRAEMPAHLVDVKVCAVDETWSGLRLMRRRR